MVYKIINDLQDLKISINNNINYSHINKITSNSIIDRIIIRLGRFNKFNSKNSINNIIEKFGGIKYETKNMVHTKIDYIKRKINYNNNIPSDIAMYAKKNLNFIKKL